MAYVYKTMKSPLGILKLVDSDKGLTAILWENDNPRRVRLNSVVTEGENHPLLLETEKLDFVGTEFQKKVWEALLTIPFGETRSYGQIAKQIGNLKAVRAVGAANGKNPISIIVPCHRVIGSNGTLAGFAGGLDAKVCLLGIESNTDFKKMEKGV